MSEPVERPTGAGRPRRPKAVAADRSSPGQAQSDPHALTVGPPLYPRPQRRCRCEYDLKWPETAHRPPASVTAAAAHARRSSRIGSSPDRTPPRRGGGGGGLPSSDTAATIADMCCAPGVLAPAVAHRRAIKANSVRPSEPPVSTRRPRYPRFKGRRVVPHRRARR